MHFYLKILLISISFFFVSFLHAQSAVDYEYTVKETDKIPQIKRSLQVNLNKKITEEQLKDLAYKLRGSPDAYKKTFIVYLLPGMQEGAGAWATTHFTPKLDVEILGISIDDEKKLQQSKKKNNIGEMIGAWKDERIGMAGLITLYKLANGQYVARITFKDGSEMDYKLKLQGKKYRFIDTEDGDYYEIQKNGDLGIGNREGLYSYFKTS